MTVGAGPEHPGSLLPPADLAAGLVQGVEAAVRTGPLRNGTPRGDPNLAPRCGARTRTTGCTCRAPAMANGRCRLHGGKSTGPRTPEGMARMIAAHTTHGGSTAAKRAMQRYVSTLAARMRLFGAALRLRAHLPAEMAARLALGPAELKAPPRPIQGAFAANESPTTSNVRNGAGTVRRGRRSGLAGEAARLALGPAELKAPARPIHGAFAANEPPTTCNVRHGAGTVRAGGDSGNAGAATRLALGPAELRAPVRPIQGAFAANESSTTSNVRNGAGTVRAGGDSGNAGAATRLALGPAELKAPPRPIQGAFAANESPTTSNVRNGAGTVRRGRRSGLAGEAARLALGPAELKAPARPIHGAFAANESSTTSNVRNGAGTARGGRRSGRAGEAASLALSGRAAERLAALAEVEGQAPWRAAIVLARAAKRTAREAKRTALAAKRAARASAEQRTNQGQATQGRATGGQTHIARPNAMQRENAVRAFGMEGGRGGHAPVAVPARWSVPDSVLDDPNALQREVAFRAAGLRARGHGQAPGGATPKPGPSSTLPGTQPPR